MNTGSLILVSAPSGAGKTSLVRSILQNDTQVVVCISHTTRTMRDDERDGENYFFVDDEKFDQMIKAGEFLEHASVFGRRYGSSRQEVDSRRAAGQDVILRSTGRAPIKSAHCCPTPSAFLFCRQRWRNSNGDCARVGRTQSKP